MNAELFNFLLITAVLIIVPCLIWLLKGRKAELTQHVFRSRDGNPIILLTNGKFRYKTDKGFKTGKLRDIIPLLASEEDRVDAAIASASVAAGVPYVSRKDFDASVEALSTIYKEQKMNRRKSQPTGRTYTTRDGRTYHQMGNGQYATNDNGNWNFVTYLILLDLLGSSDAVRLTRDHQAYVADYGQPSDTPASSTSVDGNSGGGSSSCSSGGSSSSCSSSGGSSCGSSSSCSSSGGSSCGGGSI